jgi:hypothetical protein
VLTVVTAAKTDNRFYVAHESEEAATAEQDAILEKLNNPAISHPSSSSVSERQS